MSRRRIVIIVVVVLLIAIAAIGVVAYRQHQDRKVKEQTSVETTKFANIDFNSTVEWNDQYRLHVMYPVTKESALDNAARAKIDTYVHAFKEEVAVKPKDTEAYELNLLGEVNYASDAAVNFLYSGTWSTGGKPAKQEINILFERKTGKEIQTSDLFKDSDYLKTASDTARQALPGIVGSMDYDKALAEAGTTPTAAHFDQFEIVDDHTINIIFEPGQVASAALGPVKVPLALDALDDDLNDDLVGQIFPTYIAQVKAAAAQKAEQAAEAARKKRTAPPVASNGNTDCAKVKCIALSFDDGPGPATATILDTLKANNAHATFMVVGSRVASRASLVQREAAEGHDIGNHTWDHSDLTKMDAAGVASEVDRTEQAVVDATGKRPFMVRPPYGAYNKTVEDEIGLPLILWSVDPDDWKDRNADIVYQRIMAAAKPGAILLSHDLYPTTAAAYQRIIPDLVKQGYTLVTVSDLLDLDPAHPAPGVYSSRR